MGHGGAGRQGWFEAPPQLTQSPLDASRLLSTAQGKCRSRLPMFVPASASPTISRVALVGAVVFAARFAAGRIEVRPIDLGPSATSA